MRGASGSTTGVAERSPSNTDLFAFGRAGSPWLMPGPDRLIGPEGNGGRGWYRTNDPYDVNVVLYH